MASKISYAKAASVLTDFEKMYVALDCEMVMASVNGEKPVHSLAQIAIVDWYGRRILKTYVKPEGVVTNYLEEYSGIKPKDLANAPPFKTVREKVLEIITGKIVVGHGLESDFKALKIDYNPYFTRNTALANVYRQNVRNGRTGKMIRGARKLKNLADSYLKETIQVGAHDPEIDARAAMLLYQNASLIMDFETMVTFMPQLQAVHIPEVEEAAPVPVRNLFSANAPAFLSTRNKTGKKRSHRKNRKTRKQRK